MKVCARNQKPLAWLAIGALEETQAEALRAHLHICPGCRNYLMEIERVASRLQAAESAPETDASPFFHQRLRRSLLRDRPRPIFGWGLAIPVFAMAVVLFLTSQQSRFVPALPPTPAVAAKDSDMTFLNYQTAADQSLDKLDRILMEQANRGITASPIYRAGSFLAD